jgi:hypothetical protein
VTAELIIVAEDDEQSRIVGRFIDSEGTLIRFEGLDRVSASVPGWVITMDAPRNMADAVYFANIPTVAVDKRNLVVVQRDTELNAPLSEVVMPWAVVPTADKEAFARSTESVTLTWDPIVDDDALTLYGEGTCVEELEIELDAGAGIVELVGGTLRSLPGAEGESCGVVLMLRRTRQGVVDERWLGGSFEARQERIVTVTSTP